MGQWRGNGDGEPPQPDLAFLTREQARRVRNLFRQAMAERGRELVTDSLGEFRDGEGNHYGLRNIAVLCRDDPDGEKGWPELIAGYADTLLKGNSSQARAEVAALTPEQARGMVYLSVCSAASLGPAAAGFGSAPELAPGLLQLLALDMPYRTVHLDDEEVTRLGGQESLREAALANLRAMPVSAHHRVGGPEAHLDAITGDSHFTASRALVMPDLLSRVLGTSAPHGALVALPARHLLFIHVLADKTAEQSLLKMAAMTRVAYGKEQGPISRDVLWWRDGGWMPVPCVTSDGELVVRPGPELSFVLTELASEPERG